jgi:hypothetical protein
MVAAWIPTRISTRASPGSAGAPTNPEPPASPTRWTTSEGYALALLDDRRICQIDERVVEALVGSDERGADLRALAAEGRAARRAVERLRAELAVMHDRYLALRTG